MFVYDIVWWKIINSSIVFKCMFAVSEAIWYKYSFYAQRWESQIILEQDSVIMGEFTWVNSFS